MAPLDSDEKERLLASILQELSKTPYACSSLEPLLSGTTNFTFRGHLVTALPESKVQTVVVKHTTGHVALNKDFLIDISRCVSDFIPLYPYSHGFKIYLAF